MEKPVDLFINLIKETVIFFRQEDNRKNLFYNLSRKIWKSVILEMKGGKDYDSFKSCHIIVLVTGA